MEKKLIQNHFEEILGKKSVLSEAEAMKSWAHDWTNDFPVDPLLVLFPKSTKEVSDILAYCNQNKIALVPSGGRTGLAGGRTASNKEVVLSLDKMSKIIKLDNPGMTIEVEAGAITELVQQKALEEGLFFPIDLASKGSCHIGGNIATNAGGLKFIRYGGMRDMILGLEVVLASGEILDINTNLRKNNTGYDLKQL